MYIVVVTLFLAAYAGADRRPCAEELSTSLRAPDTVREYQRTGDFTFALIERIRAVAAAGADASTYRRDELDEVAAELARIDQELNEVPGGDDAPFGGIGSGRLDYAIYRGPRGNAEIIAISRHRDRFRWEIRVDEDAEGQRTYVTTGLTGRSADAREALRMTAHRFPRRLGR